MRLTVGSETISKTFDSIFFDLDKNKEMPNLWGRANLIKFKNGLRANTIHSVDSEIVSEIILNSNFELFTIHDAFFTNASNLPQLICEYSKALEGVVIKVGSTQYKTPLTIKNNLCFK